LGENSAKILGEVGIFAQAQLEELGPVQACVVAMKAGPKPNTNLLWAIAGVLGNTN